MPLPEDTLYQYVLQGAYKGQTIMNVLWFTTKENSPKTNAKDEADAIIGEISSWFAVNIFAFANVGYQAVQATVKVMAGADPYQTVGTFTNTFGQQPGDGMPPHDAALVSLYTGYHGRSLHGRIYVPAVSEGDQEGGVLTAASMVRLKRIGDDLITRFAFNGTSAYVRLGVFSRKNGRIRFPGPPPFYTYKPESCVHVTNHVVRDLIRTQRHRRRT